MMCVVNAGKTEGEIAWIRCEGIGSRGHVVGWQRRELNVLKRLRVSDALHTSSSMVYVS